MVALVLPIVRIGLRIALFGIDDERPLPFGELTVGEDVDALVADQPKTGLLIAARKYSVVGIAETAVEVGIQPSAHHDDVDVRHGKGEHRRLPSSRYRVREVAQMHRQLRCDLRIREVVEQLQDGALASAVEEHGPLAVVVFRPALAGIAAIVIMGARPDVVQAFLARHRPNGPGFALYDCGTHQLRRALLGQVAVAVEIPHPVVHLQREKDAGDAVGEELAHGEHIAPHEQRRQDLEHVIVLRLGDFEPFASIKCVIITLPAVQALRVAVEQAEHLPAVGNAFKDFTYW
ncbi:conserved hypothetical protein (plasmid) [Rhizobium rhizogenes K84]|uniref:Uncharacterized protein n=1 Tax=Rhizobium rhizogenes (strain K84 / ATCC BAA-868) TaxID=311403 RepID=B9JP76_RHIR8|nr:conserved hypothetical protein [Rhizobium rhizogenes K84]